MRKIFVLLIGLCMSTAAFAEISVPERMQFCGIDLTLNNAARSYISNVIAKLKPGSSYFNSLVTKADIYFPFVEAGFAEAGAPDDLKYIVLQESALRGNAVSSSKAVGYWQFKEPAAREVGLVINNKIDERRHIYRASVGAGRYFYRINRDFDNWVYAIIGYNRGPYGAIPYTNKKYYGAKKMTLTGNTHWYALKAIAHKLAFQDALGKNKPDKWVETKSTNGETSVAKLAKMNGLAVDELKAENPWMRSSTLPAQDLTYFVVRRGAPIASAVKGVKSEIKGRQIGSDKPTPKPTTRPTPIKRNRNFSYAAARKDPVYGKDYVQVRSGQKLVEIAVAQDKNIKRLRKYNGFGLEHRVKKGEIIYLKSPNAVRFHIVKPGETLRDIAKLHGTSTDKLRQKNRMRSTKIYPGQRLYLKSRRPKSQKPIIIENTVAGETTAPAPKPKPRTKPAKPAPKPKATSASSATKPKPKSSNSSGKYTAHVVKPGETLWRISKMYGTTVEEIRRLNRMRNNNLYVGQKLRVPKKSR